MSKGLEQQKKAVTSGHWPLFRFDPRRAALELAELARQDIALRWRLCERLAAAYAPQTPSA